MRSIKEIRDSDAGCLTYSDGSLLCSEAGDYVAEDRRQLLRLLEELAKVSALALRKLEEYEQLIEYTRGDGLTLNELETSGNLPQEMTDLRRVLSQIELTEPK